MSQKVAKTDQEVAEDTKFREDHMRVGRKVMRTLGRPPSFVEVSVRVVRTNTYRVNVVVEREAKGDVLEVAGKVIAHSYYVREDHPESDLVSDPPIVKLY